MTDKPGESNPSAYYTIFHDGDLFRAYYRGSHGDEQAKKATHREVVWYAASKDGIHWLRIKDEPVITNGAFDSQNLAFCDAHARTYRE